MMKIPPKLLISYGLDWLVVIFFVVVGVVLNAVSGYHRPFYLSDDSIAFPLKDDIITITAAGVIACLGPLVVIIVFNIVSAILAFKRSEPRVAVRVRDHARAIAWETHAGSLGLFAGIALTFFLTTGLKDIIGKPRPDLLARCDPNLSLVSKYMVGGIGTDLGAGTAPLVTSGICRQSDRKVLDDGFASFPSGHSSISCAGLLYLSLWLCAKWSVAIPFLNAPQKKQTGRRRDHGDGDNDDSEYENPSVAPPLWQVVLGLCPIFMALVICSTRYADFHHAGIDIFAGASIGTICGWASFRLYHAPLSRRPTASPAWAPRSTSNAFFAAISNPGCRDVEQGCQNGSQQEMVTMTRHASECSQDSASSTQQWSKAVSPDEP